MKRTKILACAIISTSLLSFAAYAKPAFQAGDIAEGQTWLLTPNGVASYYKDGTMGYVTFTCDLEGDNAGALLYGAKNFQENAPATLSLGMNGPYTWALKDKGEANGNIKVQYLRGQNVTISCKEIA